MIAQGSAAGRRQGHHQLAQAARARRGPAGAVRVRSRRGHPCRREHRGGCRGPGRRGRRPPFPVLDILVNNAGATWGMPLDDFDEHAWDKVMDTNVKGVFFLTQKLLPNLRAGGHARRPGARHQHRLHRRPAREPDGHLQLCGQQGRRAPPHPCPGPQAGPRAHHGERRGARPVREQDDGRHAAGVRRQHRPVRAAAAASADPTTWPVWPCSCPAVRAATSRARSSRSTAASPPPADRVGPLPRESAA